VREHHFGTKNQRPYPLNLHSACLPGPRKCRVFFFAMIKPLPVETIRHLAAAPRTLARTRRCG
jgi:hypothetical protein